MTRIPRESVELVDSETIVAHGSCTVRWFVEVGEQWVPASESAAARVERLDAGPGTVWQSRVSVELPRGTWLLRQESRPGTAKRRDPFDYLAREVRTAARRVRRSYFVVGPSGTLHPRRRP